MKEAIARAARLLRNSFLWDDYDSMPIEPDIKEALLEVYLILLSVHPIITLFSLLW